MSQSVDREHGQAEAQLVGRARSGDREAFAALVERYQQRLWSYLRSLTGDDEIALDLTQDTFVRAYRAIVATHEQLAVRPWLYRIATNLAYDYLRRKNRLAWLPLRVVEQRAGGGAPSDIEERDLIQQALERLRPAERAILLLCGLELLTYAEAGPILGCSAEAARKQFSRAKARFRQAYTELAGDE